MINPIREGFHTITPYMVIRNAADAIEFYKKAFDATELYKWVDAEGIMRHAEIQIGNSPLMMVDENNKFPELQSSQTLGGSPIQLYIYTEDVDALFAQAVEAGATIMMPPAETTDGEKRGGLVDPFGFTWWVASKIRDVPVSEMPK